MTEKPTIPELNYLPSALIAPASLLFAGYLAGCASQSIDATAPKTTATLPAISNVAGEPSRIDANSQAVYGLIASGAMRCWFATNGQLKKSHIFHADVDPPSKGGAAEVSVLERDVTGAKLWGARTFKVALKPVGEQTGIEVENLKMPEATAALMRADVFQWAQGGKECKLQPVEVAAPPPEPAKPRAKFKVKPALAKPSSP
jgi:hypothetical protein